MLEFLLITIILLLVFLIALLAALLAVSTHHYYYQQYKHLKTRAKFDDFAAFEFMSNIQFVEPDCATLRIVNGEIPGTCLCTKKGKKYIISLLIDWDNPAYKLKFPIHGDFGLQISSLVRLGHLPKILGAAETSVIPPDIVKAAVRSNSAINTLEYYATMCGLPRDDRAKVVITFQKLGRDKYITAVDFVVPQDIAAAWVAQYHSRLEQITLY